VKPGGCIVYSTCTTEPEENFDIIREFLTNHQDYSIEPPGEIIPKDVVSANGCIETFPHRHGMDGSFAVRLRKKS
jgi:16S rRNA (cytosine967-C5)-methyltransferase